MKFLNSMRMRQNRIQKPHVRPYGEEHGAPKTEFQTCATRPPKTEFQTCATRRGGMKSAATQDDDNRKGGFLRGGREECGAGARGATAPREVWPAARVGCMAEKLEEMPLSDRQSTEANSMRNQPIVNSV